MAPIYTNLINVWPHTNWAMGTNNLTAVFEVVLIDVALVKGFLYYMASSTAFASMYAIYMRLAVVSFAS